MLSRASWTSRLRSGESGGFSMNIGAGHEEEHVLVPAANAGESGLKRKTQALKPAVRGLVFRMRDRLRVMHAAVHEQGDHRAFDKPRHRDQDAKSTGRTERPDMRAPTPVDEGRAEGEHRQLVARRRPFVVALERVLDQGFDIVGIAGNPEFAPVFRPEIDGGPPSGVEGERSAHASSSAIW